MTETMTVKQLIDKLKQYPDELRVLITWEGIHATLYDEAFTVGHVNNHVKNPDKTWSLVDAGEFLVIDADGNRI